MWQADAKVDVGALFSAPGLSAEASAGVVHDLGNLIQVAASALNVLSRNAALHDAQLEPVIAAAQASLGQAGALVRRTMEQTRSVASGAVDLGAALAEACALAQVSFGPRFKLDLSAPRNLADTVCDQLALQSAVLNLLMNARDAMPDGGRIAVAASVGKAPSGARVAEIAISDDGVGMKPETVKRAFDPFFTSKVDGTGGVGLPMVARFARAAGGSVDIESTFGVGTTVRLQLPFAPTVLDLHAENVTIDTQVQ